jgi:hypothetical protein
LPYFNGSDSATTTTLTSFARSILDDGNAATVRSTLGLGTAATASSGDFQAADATLTALAGLSTGSDKLPYFSGSDTATTTTLTSFARTLLDDTSAATALTTLGAAPTASPTFTGTPAAPTASAYTNTTQLATTAQVYATTVTEPENAQTGTSYTLVLADAGKMVTLSNSSSITLTVPPNSSVAYPVGTRIDLLAIGTGKVTVAAGSGVTIRSKNSNLKLSDQYSGATLWKQATNTWYLVGDLSS